MRVERRIIVNADRDTVVAAPLRLAAVTWDQPGSASARAITLAPSASDTAPGSR